ncbi:MAG: 30S ribosomal protein S12 methylthiotransferase RimO [Chitinophagales bacterium]|nr:30S ribosomal protein S12 methylthiotransferase RimO [Chitinophagales bacterium]
MKTRTLKKNKVNVVTLGCSKNVVDSEVLMSQLQGNQIDVVHESVNDDFNIVIVNTCGFIDKAKEESINTIIQYAEAKKNGAIDKLYVTGCLSQRYKDNLEEAIPEVDAYYGTRELPALLKTFKADYKHELVGERLLTTPQHYAYVKISEGCNRTCSFCAIPIMRGKHISKPTEELVKEVSNLAAKGVKEIMLIAQELTFYGLDIYKKRSLSTLLDTLCEIEGIEWIRLHYAYPAQFPMDVIETMARQDKICNYLDIPLQHAANKVLKSMRRNLTNQDTRNTIQEIRSILPDIAIRTTMLVGYPNETDADIAELQEFIEEMRFERLGIFTYSHEEGTHAYKLEDNIPEELKIERANQLMEVQQEISYQLNEEKVGKSFKVLFDKKEGDYFIGRTEYDSPDVDNEVLVDATQQYLSIGEFAEVKITDCSDFDLIGELVE